ncbi:hypothetical protein Ct61P_06077 [Colletotrichum tofieldiae]|nr:hypothetical protein Ct61P_06077 [Colletotrichum tofieldiae]
MTSFESLPREVLIEVFSCLADLKSASHLILASPNAFRLFASIGPAVLEKVLVKSVAPHVIRSIRLVAALRKDIPVNQYEIRGSLGGPYITGDAYLWETATKKSHLLFLPA